VTESKFVADGVAVVFGDVPAPDARVVIRWLDRGPDNPVESSGARIVAPDGELAWRHAPWPAEDELFDLPAPAPDAGVLVAGGTEERRAELEAAFAARASTGDPLPVRSEAALTREALEDAAAVILLPPGDASVALPAQAPSVLAARRLLVTPRADISFGFAAGIDHLAFARPEEAADLVESAHRVPYGYAPLRIWGAHAAERHRASAVYARLVAELELERALGRER
jgi:hypothetical protein